VNLFSTCLQRVVVENPAPQEISISPKACRPARVERAVSPGFWDGLIDISKDHQLVGAVPT